jgi:SagB-type dehydrogenase family enzyme
MTDRRLIVNPSLVLLQRRLFSPNYDGPGKWVIFDPTTRRSQLAVLQQRDYEDKALPAVLRLLLAHSGGKVDDAALAQLASAGLLTEPNCQKTGATFLSAFQRSVFDYPFYDYSTPETFQEDRQLMIRYQQDSPTPSPWTPRDGAQICLPTVDWDDLTPSDGRPFDLRHLAAVLRFTFGPIAELPHLGLPMHFRRTSPSGGAKHPSEGWLQVNTPCYGLVPGTYVYDGARHKLVVVDAAQQASGTATDQPWTISIRSRVERPMWRYRDGRSFRAVFIDAGHVIETLALLLGGFGIGISVQSGRRPELGFDWLREPEIAVVLPEIRVAGTQPVTSAEVPATHPKQGTPAVPEVLVTNPAMYFTLDHGNFQGHLVHPQVEQYTADVTDFAVLTHCIQSHRGEAYRLGDRRSTPEEVHAAVPNVTDARLQRLVDIGALISADQARPFYGEVRRWAEGGWYQPLLTWLETINSDQPTPSGHAAARHLENGGNVPSALRHRVTTRAFTPEPINRSALIAVLRESYCVDISTKTVDCYIAALNVDGYTPHSLLRWDRHSQALLPTELSVSPADVIGMTIGQSWLKNSAAAIWFVTRIDVDRPGTYFLSNVLLGRMAQAICVTGTDRGLGIFQTPAVEDRKFAAKVGLTENPTMTAYLVCIGLPAHGSR